MEIGAHTLHRPLYDLYRYSANLFDYITPSEFNPVFGSVAKKVVAISRGGGRHYFDKTVYLRFIPLALAIYGFRRWKKDNSKKHDFPVIVFSLSLFASILASLAPTVSLGFFEIPTPSYFIYKVLPMFRYYSRFGVLAILSISILAAYEFCYLQANLKKECLKKYVGYLLIAAIFIEFMIIPPFRVKDMSKVPEVYQ